MVCECEYWERGRAPRRHIVSFGVVGTPLNQEAKRRQQNNNQNNNTAPMRRGGKKDENNRGASDTTRAPRHRRQSSFTYLLIYWLDGEGLFSIVSPKYFARSHKTTKRVIMFVFHGSLLSRKQSVGQVWKTWEVVGCLPVRHTPDNPKSWDEHIWEGMTQWDGAVPYFPCSCEISFRSPRRLERCEPNRMDEPRAKLSIQSIDFDPTSANS
ncbi:hypothetical protein Ddc_05541 [Ditylenchus destructor]|nr:hypothetical protein Ddc_05541 [Ditylenchus destructor]